MSYGYLDSNNIKLNLKPGGPAIIGQVMGEMVVAGRSDGSVYAGSANKPILGRTASGDVMLVLNSEFVANILSNGTLRIMTGESQIVFRPNGSTLLTTECNGPSSRDVVDNIVALGAVLMGWSNDYPLARVSPTDEISLKTTRKGATRISQPGRNFSVITERDGSLYAGTSDRPLLARMTNGDILLSLDEDFAAVIYRNGTMAICTSADCVVYAPGRELMISSGTSSERAPQILERLYDFGADMLNFDKEPLPAAEEIFGSTDDIGAFTHPVEEPEAHDEEVSLEDAFRNFELTSEAEETSV